LELKSKNELKDEEQKYHEELESQIIAEVFAIARKALADLSESSLEDHIVPVFLRRLRDLSEKEKKSLTEGSVLVRTSLDLSAAQSSLVRSGIEETLGKGIEIKFQNDPVLIGGIELSGNGQKVSWSIEDYLARFERRIEERP
jgi:F-type H+-transporting ATPase subunit b